MLIGLRTALYIAPDLDAGKAWYTAALGHGPYFDEPFYVGFEVGGFELGLMPDGTPGAGGTRAYWGVADCPAALDRMLKLGATAHEGVQDVGGGIRVASVLDPFGNIFGLIENPNFDLKKVK
jgi:predicted enzyme related to lactoylglutathione lyase